MHDLRWTRFLQRWWRKAAIGAVLAVLVVGLTGCDVRRPAPVSSQPVSSSASVTTAAPKADPPAGSQADPYHVTVGFRVVGNELTFDGQRYIEKGVTTYVIPFYTDHGKTDPTLAKKSAQEYKDRAQLFASIKANGFNTVRIFLPPGYVIAEDAYGVGGEAGYVRMTVNVVHAANKAGLTAMLCWDSGSHFEQDYAKSFPMMRDVYHALAGDSRVLYEPYNEPQTKSWDTWTKVMLATIKFWRQSLHYRGPLILDTEGWSWAFSPGPAIEVMRADRALLGGPSQLLFANHRYNNGAKCFCGEGRAYWMATVVKYFGTFPIIGTEYGNYDGFKPSLTWSKQFMSYLVNTAVPGGLNGITVFLWSWVDPSTIMNAQGNPTAWGKIALNAIGSLPAH